jgi:hypothetical protein
MPDVLGCRQRHVTLLEVGGDVLGIVGQSHRINTPGFGFVDVLQKRSSIRHPMVPESQGNAYFDASHTMPPDAFLHRPREICPQIVAGSGTAGKCTALPVHRVHRSVITTMFCCQIVYNMQDDMRLCDARGLRPTGS